MNVQHRHGTCERDELREGLGRNEDGAQPHGYHRELPAAGESAGAIPECRLRQKHPRHRRWARHHIIHHPRRSVQKTLPQECEIVRYSNLSPTVGHIIRTQPAREEKNSERDVHGRTCAGGDDGMTEGCKWSEDIRGTR